MSTRSIPLSGCNPSPGVSRWFSDITFIVTAQGLRGKLTTSGVLFVSLSFVPTLVTLSPALSFPGAAFIVRAHDDANSQWHHLGVSPTQPGELVNLILAQHRANYDLWHQEDAARSPDASNAAIAAVKHAIDRLNQLRNDLVEQIDERLLLLAGAQNLQAPLHSETPGLIIDRLSIIALKVYHTAEEAHRPNASDQHHLRNLDRLAVLEQQRSDLTLCLDQLWTQVVRGERRFRLYRQMKMYNDPELNPVLYARPH